MIKPKFLALLGLVVLLAGCAPAGEEVRGHNVPATVTPVLVMAAPTESAAGPGQAPTAAAQPTAAAAADAACVSCHTDKQMLIDTAKPEEPAAETESEGVG